MQAFPACAPCAFQPTQTMLLYPFAGASYVLHKFTNLAKVPKDKLGAVTGSSWRQAFVAKTTKHTIDGEGWSGRRRTAGDGVRASRESGCEYCRGPTSTPRSQQCPLASPTSLRWPSRSLLHERRPGVLHHCACQPHDWMKEKEGQECRSPARLAKPTSLPWLCPCPLTAPPSCTCFAAQHF